MKTVCKKLLSLMLVAVLLMSAIPFQAFAADTTAATTATYSVVMTTNKGPGTAVSNVAYTVADATNGDTMSTVLASTWHSSWKMYYTLQSVTLNGTVTNAGGNGYADGNKIKPNDNVTFTLAPKTFTVNVTATLPGAANATGSITGLYYGDVVTAAQVKASVQSAIGTRPVNDSDIKIAGAEVPAGGYTITGNVDATVTAGALPPSFYNVKIVVSGGPHTTPKENQYTVAVGSSTTIDQAKILSFANFDTLLYTMTISAGGSSSNSSLTITPTADTTVTVTLAEDTTVTKVKLVDEKRGTEDWAYIKNGVVVRCPTPENFGDYAFEGWYPANFEGRALSLNANMAGYAIDSVYKARYRESVGTNRIGTLYVEAVYYVDGIENGRRVTNIYNIPDLPNGTANLLSRLNDEKEVIRQAIVDNKPANFGDVNWNGYFYNATNNSTLTDQNLTISGNKYVYVKVEATEQAKPDVYLHIYRKASSNTNDVAKIVNLKGYLVGENVTRSAVVAAVKNAGYTGSNMTVRMFNETEWAQLVRGNEQPGRRESYIVQSSGNKIYVLVTNATTGVNNSDNPKTGDAFYMVVTTLGVSATGLACLYFFSKKKWAAK